MKKIILAAAILAAIAAFCASACVHVHQFSEWEVIVSPTCTEEGRIKRSCACGKTEYDVLPALGHTGEWTQTSEPDCINDGLRERICSRCNSPESERIPALGHDMQPVSGKAADCEEGGYTAHEKCTRCGVTENLVILPATGHTFSEEWSYNSSSHWHAATCGHDDEKDGEEEHSFSGTECSVCGYEKPASEGLEYTLSNDRKYYTVEGIADGAEISGELVIPATRRDLPVTGIAANAFAGLPITSLILGENIETIGEYAFSGCSLLESVNFGGAETEIERFAFLNCVSITSLVIPESVRTAGLGAFMGNISLQSISLPFAGESRASTNSFFGWVFGASSYRNNSERVPSSLNTVTLTDCEIIDSNAFYGCSLKELNLPERLGTVREGAFFSATVEKISFPAEVAANMPKDSLQTAVIISGESIVQQAFYGFTSLRTVTISNSVTDIGVSAFENCAELREVTLPSGMEYISAKLFRGCAKLEKITIPEGVKVIGDNAFNGCASLKDADLPAELTDILDYAFRDCSSLTSVTIPDGVESLASSCFYGCTSISSVTFGTGLKRIGVSAFTNCTGLKVLEIPDGVESISSGAFQNCGLEYIKLPAGLQIIQTNLLADCSLLAEIEIPESVTSIGAGAFTGCSSLKTVYVPDTVQSIKNGAFSGCSSLESMVLPFVGDMARTPSSFSQYPFGYIFGTKSFEGGIATTQKYYNWNFSQPDGSTVYYIPESLKKITVTGGCLLYGAFYGCENIAEIVIGADVTQIERHAFYGCSGLEGITFANTEGWIVSPSSDSVAGTSINLSDPARNVVYFVTQYSESYFKKM